MEQANASQMGIDCSLVEDISLTPSSGRSSPSRAPGPGSVTRDAVAAEQEQTTNIDKGDSEGYVRTYGKEFVNTIFIGHVDARKYTLNASIFVLSQA